jgi:transcription initiation factor TFIIB
VFIQSNAATTATTATTASALQSIDRHHRNASHHTSVSAAAGAGAGAGAAGAGAGAGAGTSRSNKTTKKNKMIWDKIQSDFLPELLKEFTIDTTTTLSSSSDSDIHIPQNVNSSPKQSADPSKMQMVSTSETATAAATVTADSEKREKQMKLSTLFIQPETNVECLYRRASIRENCDICASDVVLTDDGFLTCKNPACSIIYTDESLDQTAEWRYYGADDNQANDPTRCGMPVNPLLVESSYGCKVMCEGGSYSQDMMKIRRYTEWQSMPYKEKAQYDMFQKITTIAQNNGISKMIIDEALRVHKRISEHKTFRSLNRDGVVGASIYISCKMHNCPRTAKEIATIFNLDNTSATKGCKNAVSIINELESNLENTEKTAFCKTKPEAFIERYCSKLHINNELTKLCQFISMKIEKKNIMPENTPPSIAAGVVYFISQICKLNISKKDVKNVSETSEVTINKCYKKLEKIKDDLMPAAILKKYSSCI